MHILILEGNITIREKEMSLELKKKEIHGLLKLRMVMYNKLYFVHNKVFLLFSISNKVR